MMRSKLIVCLGIAAGTVAAAAGGGCSGHKKEPPPPQASAMTQAVMDVRATQLLQQMSDTIAKADGCTFSAMSSEEVASPGGQWVHVLGSSRVTLKRQGGLPVESGAEGFEHELYYDGKTTTLYAPNENLYVQDVVDDKVDKMLHDLFERH